MVMAYCSDVLCAFWIAFSYLESFFCVLLACFLKNNKKIQNFYGSKQPYCFATESTLYFSQVNEPAATFAMLLQVLEATQVTAHQVQRFTNSYTTQYPDSQRMS